MTPEQRKKRPTKSPASAAQRVRTKRREFVASFRSTSVEEPTGENEQRNLEWGASVVRRAEEEASDRAARRALAWKFNGPDSSR